MTALGQEVEVRPCKCLSASPPLSRRFNAALTGAEVPEWIFPFRAASKDDTTLYGRDIGTKCARFDTSARANYNASGSLMLITG